MSMTTREIIEKVRADLGDEAAEIAERMIAKRLDSRVRAYAKRVGLEAHKSGDRYTLSRSGSGIVAASGLKAADAIRWMREFGF
jgi:flagellar biosynthesis GTPase FlhF